MAGLPRRDGDGRADAAGRRWRVVVRVPAWSVRFSSHARRIGRNWQKSCLRQDSCYPKRHGKCPYILWEAVFPRWATGVRLHQIESGVGPAKRQNCETNPFGPIWRKNWILRILSAGMKSRSLARPKGKTAKQTHLSQKLDFAHFFGEPEASGHKSLTGSLFGGLSGHEFCAVSRQRHSRVSALTFGRENQISRKTG